MDFAEAKTRIVECFRQAFDQADFGLGPEEKSPRGALDRHLDRLVLAATPWVLVDRFNLLRNRLRGMAGDRRFSLGNLEPLDSAISETEPILYALGDPEEDDAYWSMDDLVPLLPEVRERLQVEVTDFPNCWSVSPWLREASESVAGSIVDGSGNLRSERMHVLASANLNQIEPGQFLRELPIDPNQLVVVNKGDAFACHWADLLKHTEAIVDRGGLFVLPPSFAWVVHVYYEEFIEYAGVCD